MTRGRNTVKDVAYRSVVTYADGKVQHGTAYATRAPAIQQGREALRHHADRARYFEEFSTHGPRFTGHRVKDPGAAPTFVIEVGVVSWAVES